MAEGVNEQQGGPINNLSLCGNKGQNEGKDGSRTGRGDDAKEKTEKESPQDSSLLWLKMNGNGQIPLKEADQMKTDDGSNSSHDKVPGPADDTKQAPDNRSDGSKNSKHERKTEDKR